MYVLIKMRLSQAKCKATVPMDTRGNLKPFVTKITKLTKHKPQQGFSFFLMCDINKIQESQVFI